MEIPGNLSLAFEPQVLLEVAFPQPSAKPITLRAGEQLLRNGKLDNGVPSHNLTNFMLLLAETAGPPIFNVVGARSRGPFVVATVDLDAPTPQTRTSAQIRHFLGGNFFLETPRAPTLLSNKTAALSPFIQPTPPAGSDPHRYVECFLSSQLYSRLNLIMVSVAPLDTSSCSSNSRGSLQVRHWSRPTPPSQTSI